MAERVRVREIDDDEGKRLVRIVRRGTGSVVTWRRAQTVLPSAQNKKIGKSKPSEHGARIERLYAIADGEAEPREGEPEVVTCIDEFGPLNPQPRPGRTWAGISGNAKEPGREPRPRLRATTTAPAAHGTCSPPTTWAATGSTRLVDRIQTQAHELAPAQACPSPGEEFWHLRSSAGRTAVQCSAVQCSNEIRVFSAAWRRLPAYLGSICADMAGICAEFASRGTPVGRERLAETNHVDSESALCRFSSIQPLL